MLESHTLAFLEMRMDGASPIGLRSGAGDERGGEAVGHQMGGGDELRRVVHTSSLPFIARMDPGGQ